MQPHELTPQLRTPGRHTLKKRSWDWMKGDKQKTNPGKQ